MYLLGCSKYLTELSQLCNASLVLDLLAEANGPLDLHGLYCASFFFLDAHLICKDVSTRCTLSRH